MVKRDKVSDMLLNVSRVVSSSLDLDRVADLVLRESMKALRADHASLFLVEEAPGHKRLKRLALIKAIGFSASQIDNIKLLGAWEVINAELISNKSSLIVNDLYKNPAFKDKRLPFSHEKLPVRSFLAVPLEKDKRIIGVIIVSNRKPSRLFTKDDEKLLRLLSNHMAIAIANAKLFEELSMAQAEAAQNEKMAIIGTLTSGINHEISNPLGIARGQCEMFLLNLKEGLYKDKDQAELLEKAKAIMEKVISQTDRASAITKRLSSFAKPSKAMAEDVAVDKEADEVLNLLGYELASNNIDVEKHIEEGLPKIAVDRKQFQEVLFNLIRNAGHAIVKDGKITITAGAKKGRIFIDIKDTGSGISEETKAELFKPFFTTKGPGKGTGLGLFIVRKIVEKNGGKIYLKRTKVAAGPAGRRAGGASGTTFTIEFNRSGV